MSLFQLLKQYFASKRHVTAVEVESIIKRLEAVESKARGLESNATADLERQVKVLKTQVENLGLRIGFKAGSGIS